MWLVVACVPLLPAVFMVSARCRVKVASLCHGALAWALRLLRGRACAKSTHAFVFSQCTHGQADSVLQTFELYADTHPSLCIGPLTGRYAGSLQCIKSQVMKILQIIHLKLLKSLQMNTDFSISLTTAKSKTTLNFLI